ncbi:aldolase [Paenibacillus chondroitinus]|uniref:Aldolase n=1 Tax=Paenibacillus chondroitinus TaxID=59842 RepID=A0ABU6DIT5_9BACL|nr:MULTISPECIES: aldolase [Paenibacillus]MCY9660241.1 aldolase [Paenibacillus anseongense]MEB4797667.1 aldolase [Paenibacillus chondroitinus]
MLEVKQKLIYKAFGLTISSDMDLPELIKVSEQQEAADIEILIDPDLTPLYFELSDDPNQFLVKENLTMFHIPEIATFSIQDGKKITVSPMKEAEEGEIRLLVLGTCMGVILMQRKIFPLHGSALAIEGKAYAIVGDSGAGKSTLASAFITRGYQLLSDDVIAITLSQDNIPYVTPSYPQQKLWEDSLTKFGLVSSNYQSLYGRVDKYYIPVSTSYCTESLPLAGVIELVKTVNEDIEIRLIEKLERFYPLFYHTYRNFFIPGLGLVDWHFKTSASILHHIQMFQLSRPVSSFTAPQLVSTILGTLNLGE